MIAVEGMRRYAFTSEATRVSQKVLATVLENFRREGTIREKYNVVTRTTDVNITAGYQANVVGFGWTNGAFLVLLRALPAEDQKALLENRENSWRPPHQQLLIPSISFPVETQHAAPLPIRIVDADNAILRSVQPSGLVRHPLNDAVGHNTNFLGRVISRANVNPCLRQIQQ
jgi:hypothetical protein